MCIRDRNIQQQIRNFGQRTKGDKVIWALVILLVLASLLVVYSATGSLAYKLYRGNTEVYLFKQITFIILGMAVIYFAHRVNYTIWSKVAYFLFIISIPLLIYTLFFGVRTVSYTHLRAHETPEHLVCRL